jgi:hypothetical protein
MVTDEVEVLVFSAPNMVSFIFICWDEELIVFTKEALFASIFSVGRIEGFCEGVFVDFDVGVGV